MKQKPAFSPLTTLQKLASRAMPPLFIHRDRTLDENFYLDGQ
jgi:hypothetical protein